MSKGSGGRGGRIDWVKEEIASRKKKKPHYTPVRAKDGSLKLKLKKDKDNE